MPTYSNSVVLTNIPVTGHVIWGPVAPRQETDENASDECERWRGEVSREIVSIINVNGAGLDRALRKYCLGRPPRDTSQVSQVPEGGQILSSRGLPVTACSRMSSKRTVPEGATPVFSIQGQADHMGKARLRPPLANDFAL